MVFAHGPGSFLSVYALKKWWGKNVSEKNTKRLYLVGLFLGIAPDFDILYTLFIDGTHHHHEYITHTPFFYILCAGLLYSIGRLSRKNLIQVFSKVFLIATLSHMVFDSFMGSIQWLYPFSMQLIGLNSLDIIANSFFGNNGLLINLSAETFLIIAAVICMIVLFKRDVTSSHRKVLYATGAVAYICIFFALYSVAQKTYRIGGNLGISDSDNDGIGNFADLDIDGDGIPNLVDSSNFEGSFGTGSEISNALYRMQHVSFDPSGGQFYELTRRAGYFNEKDVIHKSFSRAGIFMNEELKQDYAVNNKGYVGSSSDSEFYFNVQNFYTFFKHKNVIISRERKNIADLGIGGAGDVIFALSEDEEVLGVGIHNAYGMIMFIGEDQPGRFMTRKEFKAMFNNAIFDSVRVGNENNA